MVGVVGWGAANINGQTSDGALVCNGTRYDSDAGANWPAIPNNPIKLTDCSAGVLPVDLFYFKGELAGNHVLLEWKTASEINNSHFEVMGSRDGSNWEIVSRIAGGGNSTTVKRYTSRLRCIAITS